MGRFGSGESNNETRSPASLQVRRREEVPHVLQPQNEASAAPEASCREKGCSMSVTIEVGQIWRDKDKRREREGTVRNFIVEAVDFLNGHAFCRRIECTHFQSLDRHRFPISRFGSGRANDSFELVKGRYE